MREATRNDSQRSWSESQGFVADTHHAVAGDYVQNFIEVGVCVQRQ